MKGRKEEISQEDAGSALDKATLKNGWAILSSCEPYKESGVRKLESMQTYAFGGHDSSYLTVVSIHQVSVFNTSVKICPYVKRDYNSPSLQGL